MEVSLLEVCWRWS